MEETGLVLLKLIPDCEITLALITLRAVNQTGESEQNAEERIPQSLSVKSVRGRKSFQLKCLSDETLRKTSKRPTCVFRNLGIRVKADVGIDAY